MEQKFNIHDVHYYAGNICPWCKEFFDLTQKDFWQDIENIYDIALRLENCDPVLLEPLVQLVRTLWESRPLEHGEKIHVR